MPKEDVPSNPNLSTFQPQSLNLTMMRSIPQLMHLVSLEKWYVLHLRNVVLKCPNVYWKIGCGLDVWRLKPILATHKKCPSMSSITLALENQKDNSIENSSTTTTRPTPWYDMPKS